ncbi:hypothetical protein AB6876_03420 [Carnobacterium maltaromaticum]|uniref:hypothetical protein n=1 Tax=Carnobacterium maltaromaticum TaxID=2751 RepID=UPI0039BDE323
MITALIESRPSGLVWCLTLLEVTANLTVFASITALATSTANSLLVLVILSPRFKLIITDLTKKI